MHSVRGRLTGRLIFTGLLVAALSACVPTYVWVKPGSTQQEGARDLSDCEMRAASAFPYSEQTIVTQQGYSTQGQTICGPFGNQVMCNTPGGGYVAPKGYTVDRNEEARVNAYNRCMVGKGWELKEEKPKQTSATVSKVPTNTIKPGTVGVGAACSRNVDCEGALYCVNGACKTEWR
jgi:hypothetical protein